MKENLAITLPVKTSNHNVGVENKVAEVWSEDSDLCRHVVEIDPAIRVAAIVNGSSVRVRVIIEDR